MSDETEREQEGHDASDVEEMRSQVAWLERGAGLSAKTASGGIQTRPQTLA